MEPIRHLEWLETQVSNLNPAQQVAFGSLCFERQWTVLLRACKHHPALEGVATQLQGELDLAWEAVDRDAGVARVPNRSIAEGLSCESEVETFVFYMANGVLDFVEAVSEGDFAYANHAASNPIESIEMLAESLEDSRQKQLLAREIAQQRLDLETLHRLDLKSSAAMRGLREEANRYDLFDGEWFC